MKHLFCILFIVRAASSVVLPDVPVAKAPVAVVTGIEPNHLTNSPKVDPVVVPAVVPQQSQPAPASVPVAPVVPPVAAQAAPVPPVVPEVAPQVPAAPAAPAAPVAPVVPVVPAGAQAAPVPVVPVEAPSKVSPVVEDKNAQDASGLLNEPIDKATKLVIDLDEHLKKYLPAEDEVAPTQAPHAYSGSEVGEAEADNAQRQNQMTDLINRVNQLAESIENTITDLVARRRYVTAAMLRSMLNYVRRVRVNLERLQNRLQSVQAVATSGQNAPPSATAGIPGASFFNPIRDRINRLTEEIGALVTRIRSTFTPGAPTASPLPPLATASPSEVSAAAASASIASAVGTINAAGPGGIVATSAAAAAVTKV